MNKYGPEFPQVKGKKERTIVPPEELEKETPAEQAIKRRQQAKIARASASLK